MIQKTVITLSEAEMRQALLDYIEKGGTKPQNNTSVVSEIKITYLNGSVVEKPTFTDIELTFM